MALGAWRDIEHLGRRMTSKRWRRSRLSRVGGWPPAAAGPGMIKASGVKIKVHRRTLGQPSVLSLGALNDRVSWQTCRTTGPRTPTAGM
jgi:hypothetical protein